MFSGAFSYIATFPWFCSDLVSGVGCDWPSRFFSNNPLTCNKWLWPFHRPAVSEQGWELQSIYTYAITRSCKKTLSPWQSDGIQPQMKTRRSCWKLLKIKMQWIRFFIFFYTFLTFSHLHFFHYISASALCWNVVISCDYLSVPDTIEITWKAIGNCQYTVNTH